MDDMEIPAESAVIQNEEDGAQVPDKDTVSFLIFSVNTNRFAIDISLVQEIVRDSKVHFLPFVPEYIEGVINYAGKPYTVVNPVVLNDDDEASLVDVDSPTFLLFKRDDDQFCLHVSMVEVFYEVLKEDLEEEDWENEITYKGRQIPLLKPDKIEERLRRDLGKI